MLDILSCKLRMMIAARRPTPVRILVKAVAPVSSSSASMVGRVELLTVAAVEGDDRGLVATPGPGS